METADADSWLQVFTDATSCRQCAFQALVVGLMDEDRLLDPVIVSFFQLPKGIWGVVHRVDYG